MRALPGITWLVSTLLAGVLNAAAESQETAFTYAELPIATESAEAGDGAVITLKGQPFELEGPAIRVGDALRDATVTGQGLVQTNLVDTRGTVRIISIVPSVDTKVCEQQTHYLSEKNEGLDEKVELITVSVDTPFAHGRFAEEAKIGNVTFYSDYRGGAFGKAHGLLLTGPHILARTVMVVDEENVIRHLQITPEVAVLPDLDAAFEAARRLVNE